MSTQQESSVRTLLATIIATALMMAVMTVLIVHGALTIAI
jgi:hypothetical protein